MSVIVKNMELTAESCLACRFLVCDDFEEIFECTALEKFMGKDELPKGRRSDCPLVELIRCKDCKHWKSEYAEVGGCDMFKSAGIRCSTMSDFFCGMAKPKETEK